MQKHKSEPAPVTGSRFRSLAVLCMLIVVLAVNLPNAVFAASSSSFALQGSTQLASGAASSSNFGLQSCVEEAPSGISNSSSFGLQSGCPGLSAAALLPPAPPMPPSPTEPAVAVPFGSNWAMTFLLLAITWFSIRALRRRSAGVV